MLYKLFKNGSKPCQWQIVRFAQDSTVLAGLDGSRRTRRFAQDSTVLADRTRRFSQTELDGSRRTRRFAQNSTLLAATAPHTSRLLGAFAGSAQSADFRVSDDCAMQSSAICRLRRSSNCAQHSLCPTRL